MHPLLRRFLDVSKVTELLEQPAADADGAALIAAIDAEKDLRRAVLAAKGKAPSQELQQRLIVASTRAAAARLLVDAALGAPARAAIAAVIESGGTEADGVTLVQQAVLDEAFGWADDPEAFDQTFLAETLTALGPLAKVDSELVETWVDEFVKKGAAPTRPLRLAVAESLLEAAWGDGPQPIAPEHVDDAIDALAGTVASKELERAGETLTEFLAFLGSRQIVGAQRLQRLTDVARSAARAPDAGDDEVEADEEEE